MVRDAVQPAERYGAQGQRVRDGVELPERYGAQGPDGVQEWAQPQGRVHGPGGQEHAPRGVPGLARLYPERT